VASSIHGISYKSLSSCQLVWINVIKLNYFANHTAFPPLPLATTVHAGRPRMPRLAPDGLMPRRGPEGPTDHRCSTRAGTAGGSGPPPEPPGPPEAPGPLATPGSAPTPEARSLYDVHSSGFGQRLGSLGTFFFFAFCIYVFCMNYMHFFV